MKKKKEQPEMDIEWKTLLEDKEEIKKWLEISKRTSKSENYNFQTVFDSKSNKK